MMNCTVQNSFESNILIVDDQPQNVTLLEAMLKHAGYINLTSTSDSREVEDLFQRTKFDLILLDIQMPHLSGLDILEWLSGRVRADYLPVLVLTAQTDMETRLAALKGGAKDFITKPFNTIEVLNRISNMLEIRNLFKERQRQNEILESKVLTRTLELENSNLELSNARLEIIHNLGRAGEYRDDETGNHVWRMSKSCEMLALAAGLGEDLAQQILLASPLHDVGKIGIPDKILLKPGRFDAAEWEIMKGHVEIGADIIGNPGNALMDMAQSIVLNHHEKWDGSGYPAGLRGEEIPIEGRIAAICDVFDALTSERPYKKAWTDSDATDYLRDNMGSHFDPQLATLFIELLPGVVEIRSIHSDAK